jgi:hypothetical protein
MKPRNWNHREGFWWHGSGYTPDAEGWIKVRVYTCDSIEEEKVRTVEELVCKYAGVRYDTPVEMVGPDIDVDGLKMGTIYRVKPPADEGLIRCRIKSRNKEGTFFSAVGGKTVIGRRVHGKGVWLTWEEYEAAVDDGILEHSTYRTWKPEIGSIIWIKEND